jgi:DNA (cytosine-5)-methyltransferase 1
MSAEVVVRESEEPKVELSREGRGPLFSGGECGGDGYVGEVDLPTERVEEYVTEDEGRSVRRTVRRKDGPGTSTSIDVHPSISPLEGGDASAAAAAFDYSWLRLGEAPTSASSERTIRVADLFSGCGGMTLGAVEACRALGIRAEPVYGADIDENALSVFARNFEEARTVDRTVERYLDGDLNSSLSENERIVRRWVARRGGVDLLVGGPPCQGHSSLNNRTQRSDPKNRLYLRMARAAEVLDPDHIIIENVIGVQHDDEGVFEASRRYLENRLGYTVEDMILRGEKIGIPQTRARVFMVATKQDSFADREQIEKRYGYPARSFLWACEDLADVENSSSIDEPSRAKKVTQRRIDHLFDEERYDLPDSERPPCHRDGKHTYGSVYGRIHGDKPSPTITTGYTTMGRGRFVHPIKRRTITPHEAARIQFFPDYFDFVDDLNRSAHKQIIGNAVPPKMTYVLALELLR